MSFTPEELLERVLPRLENVSESDGQITGRCPLHSTEHPRQRPFSMQRSTGLWSCHSSKCGRKGNAYQLAQELGCLPPLSRDKALPAVNWGLDSAMVKYGLKVHERGVIFPVRDHEGNRCRDHVRLHEGEPRFQFWGKGRTYHALVDWPLVREWGKGAGIGYMVEGNRDWLTLAAHGWPAIGILGVKNFAAARQDAFSHIKAAGIGAR